MAGSYRRGSSNILSFIWSKTLPFACRILAKHLIQRSKIARPIGMLPLAHLSALQYNDPDRHGKPFSFPCRQHLASPYGGESGSCQIHSVRIWLSHCIRQFFHSSAVANFEVLIIPPDRFMISLIVIWASIKITLTLIDNSK